MEILLFSLTSALNPTLLAATTAMLILPDSGRLMIGYWLGAMAMSIASGLILVYALQGSGAATSAKKTLTPVEDFVLAGLVLLAALVLASGADRRVHRTRKSPNEQKNVPKWKQRLNGGTLRTTILIGAALSLPGATYLLLLDRLSKLHYGPAITTLVLIGSNLIQLVLLEIPMIAFLIWPQQTPNAIDSAKAWTARHGREYGAAALVLVAAVLLVRGATRAW